MLPKAHRLRRRQEFSAVYQLGLRRGTAHLTLRALGPSHKLPSDDGLSDPLEELQPTRIGISISQKVSKHAVIRNRIKRRIRAIARQMLPLLPPGWQIVVVVKPGAEQCGYGRFLQELKQLLIDAEVFDGHSRRGLL